MREEQDGALEVLQRVGRWLKNYLETGGRGDPATIEAVQSMEEVKAMFGTKLQRYGERIAQEAREVGREAGREDQQVEVARRMIERGFATDEIADLTGLSSQRIEDLRK